MVAHVDGTVERPGGAAPAVMTKYEKDEWLQGTRVTLS